jgi:uncharacterized membrane protein YkoI
MNLFLAVSALGLAACQHEAQLKPSMEVACFQVVRVSLKDAVLIAEEEVGGKAVEAAYRQNAMWGCAQDTPGVYDVTVSAGGEMQTVTVHARSRVMGEPETNVTMLSLLGRHHISHRQDFAQPGPDWMSITQAIEIAERRGGKAMAAWIENNSGKSGYRIELVQRGRTNLVWVSPKT